MKPETPHYTAAYGSLALAAGQHPIDQPVWHAPAWSRAQPATLPYFHPRSASHHPLTTVRLLHDEQAFYLRFDVNDRYVLAKAGSNQESVCQDSCVEFFCKPTAANGYFNFEFNCGGTMLASYVEDPRRVNGLFMKFQDLSSDDLDQIAVAHTLPKRIDPEIATTTNWSLCCRIPFKLLKQHIPDLDPHSPVPWRCNFYKCADASSHPHWAAWSPIGEELNFHQPRRFGELALTW